MTTNVKLRASELKLGEIVTTDTKRPAKIIAIAQDGKAGWEAYTRIVFDNGTGWSFIPHKQYDDDQWVLAALAPEPAAPTEPTMFNVGDRVSGTNFKCGTVSEKWLSKSDVQMYTVRVEHEDGAKHSTWRRADQLARLAPSPAPALLDAASDAIERDKEQYIADIETNLKTRDVQYVDRFGETDEFANVSDDAGTHMLWLVSELRMTRAALDGALDAGRGLTALVSHVTTERDRLRDTIVEATAAANEGKWNTVKTALEAVHHDRDR